MKGEGDMTQIDKWLIRLALVGVTACVLAGGLFWLVLTRPVAVAMVLDRAF